MATLAAACTVCMQVLWHSSRGALRRPWQLTMLVGYTAHALSVANNACVHAGLRRCLSSTACVTTRRACCTTPWTCRSCKVRGGGRGGAAGACMPGRCSAGFKAVVRCTAAPPAHIALHTSEGHGALCVGPAATAPARSGRHTTSQLALQHVTQPASGGDKPAAPPPPLCHAAIARGTLCVCMPAGKGDQFRTTRCFVVYANINRLFFQHLAHGGFKVPPPVMARCVGPLEDAMSAFGQATKLAMTQFPFPWAQVVLMFLVLMAASLPFMIVAFIKEIWVGIFMSFVVVTTYWSLNEVAVEMEDPFGCVAVRACIHVCVRGGEGGGTTRGRQPHKQPTTLSTHHAARVNARKATACGRAGRRLLCDLGHMWAGDAVQYSNIMDGC